MIYSGYPGKHMHGWTLIIKYQQRLRRSLGMWAWQCVALRFRDGCFICYGGSYWFHFVEDTAIFILTPSCGDNKQTPLYFYNRSCFHMNTLPIAPPEADCCLCMHRSLKLGQSGSGRVIYKCAGLIQTRWGRHAASGCLYCKGPVHRMCSWFHEFKTLYL